MQVEANALDGDERPYEKRLTEMVTSFQLTKNDFKLEVEALISKDISYVTEEYVPARLAERDWLD